jgi:hypothetical protein
MGFSFLSRAILAGLATFTLAGVASAQFFTGAPSGIFTTTSGTVSNTPAVTPNQLTKELDLSGQLVVDNALPNVQTAYMNVNCQLDQTYNGGGPLLMQLQINQSGFVNTPQNLGNIYGWSIMAYVTDVNGGTIAANMVQTSAPNAPYGPGMTPYAAPVAVGPVFSYNPAIADKMFLTFGSDFDGLTAQNQYVWDFPLSVSMVVVPEPASLGLVGVTALVLRSRRIKSRDAARG